MPFQKGHNFSSGRPKGSKNKRTLMAQDIFKPYAESAIMVISEIMESDESPAAVRLNAAKLMIERIYGKVPDDSGDQPVDMADDEYAEALKKVLTADEYQTLVEINEKLEQAGK